MSTLGLLRFVHHINLCYFIIFTRYRIGEACNVIDFVSSEDSQNRELKGSRKRHYIDLVVDGGTPRIDSSVPNDLKYRRIVEYCGGWHGGKNVLELVMDLLQLLNADELARIWGFTSKDQVKLLFSCKKFRKSRDFILEGVLPAMWDALLYECYLNCVTATAEAGGDINDIVVTADTLWRFIDDSGSHDATAANNIMLFKVILAYKLMQDGIKENLMSLYDSARIYLLPYVFACNHRVYASLHVEELVRLYHRVKPEVLDHRAAFFTLNGKSWDELQEEMNKRQKQCMSKMNPTPLTMKESSVAIREGDCVRLNFQKQLDIHRRSGRERTGADHTAQKEQLACALVNSSFFSRSGRSKFFDMTHRVVPSGNTMRSLHAHGLKSLKVFFQEYKKTGKLPTVPAPADCFKPKTSKVEQS